MNNGAYAEVPFAASFPLPFRVLFLIGLEILGWAANLHGLETYQIDAGGTLELRTTDIHRSPLPTPNSLHFVHRPSALYAPIYRMFIAYSVWCLSAWVLFRYLTRSSFLLVDFFRYIPALCALSVLTILICPLNMCHKRERDMFLRAIWRCLSSPFNEPVHFSDVVFADVFTSFAKVLGDVWLSTCMLLPGGSLLETPPIEGWTRWILPMIMSLPYVARLRQCLVEHMSPNNEGRRHLYNALKYASSFPVIYLSAAQRTVVSDLVLEKGEEVTKQAWHGEHPLFRMWLLAAAINSLYSFWWDVTNDWGFDLLKPQSAALQRDKALPRKLVLPSLHSASSPVTNSPRHSPSSSKDSASGHDHAPYPYGLRSTLLYPLPVYPLIIFLNLVLRLTWSIKLSSHLHSHSEGSEVIFWLEIAEVVRRWAWVYIRVEWEAIRRDKDGFVKHRSGGTRTVFDADSVDEDEYELIHSEPSRGYHS